jgi:hypothetical protein
MDLFQTILPSGRGVRYRTLTPTERDDVLLKATQLCGKDATNAEVGIRRLHEQVVAMLHSVTTNDTKTAPIKKVEELATAKWEKLDVSKLTVPGPLSYDTLFNAKDDAALGYIFNAGHDLSKDEADAIVGKAQPVSVD